VLYRLGTAFRKQATEVSVGVGNISLLGTFLEGLFSFLSPCVLPLTPIYIAQLTGPAIWQMNQLDRRERGALRKETLLHAASFVAGFALTFISLGATASVLGSFLDANQLLLRHVGGVILVGLGLQVAGLFQIPLLGRERRLTFRPRSRNYLISLLVGLIFAIGWTPCVGPILGGVLLLAAQAHTLGSGVLLLAVYSLGLGIPFLLLGVAFDRVAPLLKRLTSYVRPIEIVAGALLALMGVIIFFNWLLIINSRFAIPGMG
jgi:cytochrome c-type biogenesis protein